MDIRCCHTETEEYLTELKTHAENPTAHIIVNDSEGVTVYAILLWNKSPDIKTQKRLVSKHVKTEVDNARRILQTHALYY